MSVEQNSENVKGLQARVEALEAACEAVLEWHGTYEAGEMEDDLIAQIKDALAGGAPKKRAISRRAYALLLRAAQYVLEDANNRRGAYIHADIDPLRVAVEYATKRGDK